MKNALSTVFVLFLVVGSAIGVYFVYQSWFAIDDAAKTPEQIMIDVEQRVGQPFLKAWIARDIDEFKTMFQGEFEADVPAMASWESENSPAFETRTRTCDEEQQESSQDLNQILGYLFDPIVGLKNSVQTEFSVLELSPFRGNMWLCRVHLVATGFDESGHAMKYASEQQVVVRLPPVDSELTPGILAWQFMEESIIRSIEPIQESVFAVVGRTVSYAEQDGYSIDLADFDSDDQIDIAITFSDSKRAVLVMREGKYEDTFQTPGIRMPLPLMQGPLTLGLDINEDGKIDLLSGQQIFRNDGSQFVDVTDEFPSSISLGQLRRMHFIPTNNF